MSSSQARSPVFILLFFVLGAFLFGSLMVDPRAERAAALIFLCAFTVIGMVVLRFVVTPEQRSFMSKIFLISIALRAVVSFIIYYTADFGTFAMDEYAYYLMGKRIAERWQGQYFGSVVTEAMGVEYGMREPAFSYVVGTFFFFLGDLGLVARMFNCFIGALTVIYYAKFAWELMGEWTGKFIGVLTAIFPSFVLWSSLLLKDPLATFCIIYSLYLTWILSKKFDVGVVIRLVLALIVLGLMRGYLFPLVGSGIGLSFFLSRSKHVLRNYAMGLVLVIAFFFSFRAFEFTKGYAESVDFQQLNYYRKSLAEGGSAIHVDADISSPGKALAFLPVGLTYFLFAPFPWAVGSFRQGFAIPEVLLWYWFFPPFVRGLIYAFRNRFTEFAPAISVMILVSVTYSLVEGNMGTAYRHRAQVMGIYLLFVALGMALKRPQRLANLDRTGTQ